MSQDIWSSINPSVVSGSQLAALLNSFKEAMTSEKSGTSRPAELDAGGTWVDITDIGSGFLYYKIFDGISDITMVTINTTLGSASLGGADAIFEIQKVANDDVPAILDMFKRRSAGTGQTIASDSLGRMRFRGYTDGSVKADVSYFEVEMNENLTASSKGSSLRYFAALNGSGAVVEIFTVRNGNFGIGNVLPEEKLHVTGKTLVENTAISSVAATVKLRKSRNLGQVLSADEISSVESFAVDDTLAEAVTASVKVIATENHTATNKGSKAVISNTLVGAAAPSEAIVASDFIQLMRKTIASEIQIGPGAVDVDGNFKFVLGSGELLLQSRTAGVWTTCQSWGQL